ncbi:hypothetical protein PPSIR1_15365 [Plesiocystis pacifica SIR-1]|uniref:Lipoprotein n=1 Tax=Plesiocystis pacifica SIR-1 TaxID=391625 RepID=A6GFJ8_9BACT|nr:hypothetical protein [Plesiocystis pacifica]EDM75370.1 hypothetical protein PPSIR1_15365 [Plesiocystis pacifica SIR-1]
MLGPSSTRPPTLSSALVLALAMAASACASDPHGLAAQDTTGPAAASSLVDLPSPANPSVELQRGDPPPPRDTPIFTLDFTDIAPGERVPMRDYFDFGALLFGDGESDHAALLDAANGELGQALGDAAPRAPGRFELTAISNRLDLREPGRNCGEVWLRYRLVDDTRGEPGALTLDARFAQIRRGVDEHGEPILDCDMILDSWFIDAATATDTPASIRRLAHGKDAPLSAIQLSRFSLLGVEIRVQEAEGGERVVALDYRHADAEGTQFVPADNAD